MAVHRIIKLRAGIGLAPFGHGFFHTILHRIEHRQAAQVGAASECISISAGFARGRGGGQLSWKGVPPV
jgi:hypothetical protein